jgi:hypothetical protein
MLGEQQIRSFKIVRAVWVNMPTWDCATGLPRGREDKLRADAAISIIGSDIYESFDAFGPLAGLPSPCATTHPAGMD